MKWKPIWRLTMIGAAIALSAGIAAGGVGDLEYVKSRTSAHGLTCTSRRPVSTTVPKATGLHSPKAVLLSDKGPVCVILDAAAAGKTKLTAVRVDAAGAGDFRQAITVKSRLSGTTGSFGPQTVDVKRNGKTIPVVIYGHFHTGSSVRGGAGVTAMAEGTCAFGKTTRKIRIVDGNGNLSLSDAATPPFGVAVRPKGDGVLVADAAGKFASSIPTSFVGQPVQVDGAWYVVSVDGLKASAAPIEGKGGKISVKGGKWTCTLAGEKYYMTVTGDADPVAVPAGSYRVLRYRLTMPAKTGTRGPMISGSAGAKPVVVNAGQCTPLPIGSSIDAKVTARKSGTNVVFSLAQTDPIGAKIGSVLVAGGKRPPKPSIEVVSAAGAVVYTASLEYG